MSLFGELKRRNVFRVGIAYLVTTWLLIQIADTVFPRIGLPEAAVTLVIALLLLGFIPALILAWAYELTPDGIKRDRDVDQSRSITAQTGRKLDRAIIAVLIVTLAYFAFDKYALTPSDNAVIPQRTPRAAAAREAEGAKAPERVSGEAGAISEPTDEKDDALAPPNSIAILPFENISRDSANDPFTTGIHDDLLTQVSKISSLKAISRTSVMSYQDTDKTVPEIARELGVANVLEGGVQRVGERVRINVQLIDARTDEHLWAESFDRELSAANIFAIQSEIASAVARALQTRLSAEEKGRLETVPTQSMEALEAYFAGRQLTEERNEPSIRVAIEKFGAAIAIDPEFAPAHAGLAYAWLILPEYAVNLDLAEVRTQSEGAVQRALALDPELPLALTSAGWVRLIQHYDWPGAESYLRRALDIRPTDVEALHWLSHVLSWQGRHEEAIAVARQAVVNDPLSLVLPMNLSYILMDAGQLEEATTLAGSVLDRDPTFVAQRRNVWLMRLRAGQPEDAAAMMVKWAEATNRDVEAAQEIGLLLIERRDSGEAAQLPDELLARVGFGLENLAQVLAYAGDRERTLAALDQAIDERSGSRSVLSMKINPLYDFLRGDARFQELLTRVNLSQ